MLKLTLDRNCLIDIEDQRPNATYVKSLIEANSTGKASVSVLGITASERSKAGAYSTSYSEFLEWIRSLEAADLNLLKPIGVWDVTYWDWSVSASEEDSKLLAHIHDLMFPGKNSSWQKYAIAKGVASDNRSSRFYHKWINAHCDAQAVWACIRYEQDALVTSNTKDFQRNFQKLQGLGLKNAVTPKQAVALIC